MGKSSDSGVLLSETSPTIRVSLGTSLEIALAPGRLSSELGRISGLISTIGMWGAGQGSRAERMHAPSAPSKSDRTSLSGSSARIESGVRAGGARCICCKGPHDPGRCAGHRTGRIATEYVANAGNDDRGRRDFRIVNAFSISGRYGVDIPCDAHWRGDYRSLRERSGICVGCQRRLLVIDGRSSRRPHL